MFKLENISSRIIAPVLFVTVLFSVALYYVANLTISGLIEQNLTHNAKDKIEEIAVSEKRIADAMLTEAALFSNAQAVQSAYQTAHTGNIRDDKDTKMEEARGQLRSYFASIEKGYKSIKNGKSFRIHFHVPSTRSLLRFMETQAE